MEIEYSQATPDIEALYALYQTTGWYDQNPIQIGKLAQAIGNSQLTISAYAGKKLIGFGRVVTDGALHAMIYEMIVDPSFQRKGIGNTILQKLVEYCRKRDVRDIQLFCARGKRSFYEKLGFEARPDDAPGMQYRYQR
jgi:ribosomal protein S18 acetylase RimI-like enzyme